MSQPPDPTDLPPISRSALKALFDHLDRPDPPPCLHTHDQTIDYLIAHDLPVEETLSWLQRHGAGCDCEVILNTDYTWGKWAGRSIYE